MGSRSNAGLHRHRFHGDPSRFPVVARFIAERFPDLRYVADVAGGRGMLARLLVKRHGFDAEVVDPRGWTLRGVASREEEFVSPAAEYYDLVVGLHPDQALREVVSAAMIRPTLVVPCCNFWSSDERLGRGALMDAIDDHHRSHCGAVEPVVFSFRGPYNHGLILDPPRSSQR